MSGVSNLELSYAARVSLISLRDRPDQDTPQEIAAAPLGLGPEDVRAGLRELHALGLALQAGGHWQLTQNGSHHEPRPSSTG